MQHYTHVPCDQTIIKYFSSVFIILLGKVVYDSACLVIPLSGKIACWCFWEERSRGALQCKGKAHSDGCTCANTSARNVRLVSEGWMQSIKIDNTICG